MLHCRYTADASANLTAASLALLTVAVLERACGQVIARNIGGEGISWSIGIRRGLADEVKLNAATAGSALGAGLAGQPGGRLLPCCLLQ
jgi:hypothetical protein